MTNPNDQAFPHFIDEFNEESFLKERHKLNGLTKRELFAVMAMHGQLIMEPNRDAEPVARHSVLIADALIKELSK